jgi:hypothetical protein
MLRGTSSTFVSKTGDSMSPGDAPAVNCVTEKIDEYSRHLKEESYDRWGVMS